MTKEYMFASSGGLENAVRIFLFTYLYALFIKSRSLTCCWIMSSMSMLLLWAARKEKKIIKLTNSS